tara:strand:- start:339 stop:617 length:279 start_codon:yes stop_codon:yes gene_type:complete
MNKPKNIEETAQLLTGIGASSWFHISKEEEENYRIKRYSEEGKEECSRIFTVNDTTFNINKPFKFTYISHCKECTVLQNNKTYIFKTEDYEY